MCLLMAGKQQLLTSGNTDRRRLILGSVEVVKTLEPDTKFLSLLRAKGSLSESDYQRICIEPIKYRRNVQLIDVLLRGTENMLKDFLDTADETNQHHTVKPLFTGGQ